MTRNSSFLVVGALLTATHSFAPPRRTLRRPSPTPSLCSHRQLPGDSNDNNGNRKPAWLENAEYWAEREALEKLNANSRRGSSPRNKTPAPGIGDEIGGQRLDRNAWSEGGNTFAHLYNPKSTDQFKLPFEEQADIVARMQSQQAPPLPQPRRDVTPQGGVPEWFGSNTRTSDNGLPPVNGRNPNGKQLQGTNNYNTMINPYGEGTHRHSFQTTTTDDFRKPYGMPDSIDRPQLPPSSKRKLFKAPFQTSSTDDFKRSSDVASGPGAPQQPIYANFMQSSNNSNNNSNQRNAAWQNSVGQDAYESTQLPTMRPLGGEVSQQATYKTNPSQSSAILTGFDGHERDVVQTKSSRAMLLHKIKWPLFKDPPGDSPEFPLLHTRVGVIVLATLSTRYLHLCNGFSPVLASSAMTFLISTCIDPRLGQAALCGSLAGMSGGHIVPNLSVALALGALTSLCYEILIHMSNLFAGIGGRLGATAFLATGIVAKYRHVGSVGRKLRRGMWKAGVGPSSILVSMILCHVVGAVATILLRESSDDSGAADPVRASSVVGMLGSLFIRDSTSLLAFYGGSFVGMSLPSRLMDGNPHHNSRTWKPQTATSLVTSFALAAAVAGLIHATTIHHGYCNAGWGGKVGLCAFAGCWMYRGFGNMLRLVKERT
ncbi:hypothetical protein HJC23_009452 [Cyclotella cryptica]|uniref:Uncharacterized protein n=1 Tax=Cyclotella cryptica TaxID=29204 RepID=A0ABD3Q211_9STRA|eukprot:CCRYP_009548-RA/>CCRYP_009548-RA protein AED:0.28 eAED:0.28 QI:0/-1/0/1/-1/1/1/0/655